MQPVDLIARMLRDDDAAILFDRRQDFTKQARALGYDVVASVGATSPIGGAPIHVALLRPGSVLTTNAPRPAKIGERQEKARIIRLLDRFFVPAAGDPGVSALLFDLIADRYEELTGRDVNRSAAEILLRSALRRSPKNRTQRVLDFGCGTGFALDACKRIESDEWIVDLVGTDISDAMLSIARGRGQRVLTLAEWRAEPSASFDAAISCFVLHYGVLEQDLVLIARQLKPGGVFSANFFKGNEARVTQITAVLGAAGLDLISNEHLDVSTDSSNRHLVFAKRGESS